jgi:hypothetical protein
VSDLQVVYDPSLQVGGIVDLDTNMGWGPICPGPEGGALLQSFIDGMPFDITMLTSEQARDIFMSVFREQAAESLAAQGQDTPPNMDTAPDTGPDEHALAAAEAVASAGAPPAPAPADTDMAANESTPGEVTPDPTATGSPSDTPPDGSPAPPVTTTTTNCLVCNAEGTGSTNPSCLVCGGSGKIRAA